jgi:predicted kinase
VLVSGIPGSGKTTIAGPLAADLGFALLGKDRIKETLADVLGAEVLRTEVLGADELGAAGPALTFSQRLGAAAMEVLWALAADAPAVVLDANFWIEDERQVRRIRALSACPVEVYCTCPPELAAQRFLARSASRHRVHVGASLQPEVIARSARPVGLGEVIRVDTTGPVNVAELAEAVRACLSGPGGPAAGREVLLGGDVAEREGS